MTITVDEPAVALTPASFPEQVSRSNPGVWPATQWSYDEAKQHLTAPPFIASDRSHQARRGTVLVLDWLASQPGSTWQDRWSATGVDLAPATWRQIPAAWLRERSPAASGSMHAAMVGALPIVISGDLFRPALTWLVGGGQRIGLSRVLAASRDPEGFAKVRAYCEHNARVSRPVATQMAYRCAQLLSAKGGTLAEIVLGDVMELFATEARLHRSKKDGRVAFYQMLRELEILCAEAPTTLRGVRTAGQRTAEELIDRYNLTSRPIRDLLVEYLRERQPTLDYTTLDDLSYYLGKRFWADLEAHHPGIDSLRLTPEAADAWKRRIRTRAKTTVIPGGATTQVNVERINFRQCMTAVRVFYLDLAQWALEEPGRWGPWAAPCPIGNKEVNSRKAKRHLKARMDARTRERLPVLPILVRSVNDRRRASRALLVAAQTTPPGQTFTEAGTTLRRSVLKHCSPGTVWADDSATGKRRNLSREEDHAFWVWAIVEVLRTTGIRVEELLEISHHSLVQYRLPTTGELVPLLQIVPSKTDAERLLVISPDLAEVISTIICRVRDRTGAVPLVNAYDGHERLWLPPAPRLFQRRVGTEIRAISASGISRLLNQALAETGLANPIDGQPLHYTPHDFRRMFITDAILNGLPPHIAQIIAGHRDINTTLGYKAVYPEEAVQAHLAFLGRRRALRPSDEYRTPTDDEWQQFLGHFERRKVSIGTCARAFNTPCIHEHACVRCPMLWPDPAQQARLIEIRDNLLARVAEAEREGWLGEVEGLRISLAGAEAKLAQLEQQPQRRRTIELGFPTIFHAEAAR